MRPALRGRQPGSASPVLLSFLTAVFLVAAISLLLLVSHPHHEALVDSASLVRPAAGVPAAGGAGSCAVHLSDTELGGDVVSWGANHKLDSAGACCAACSSTDACNVWVYCSNPDRCGEHHQECWLKKLADPWEDVDALQGKSGRWTSGVKGRRPDARAGAGLTGARPPGPPPEVAVVTEHGEFRLRLFSEGAPLAAAFVREVARVSPGCTGCKFYRAEPVPPNWGSLDAPDSWDGGRWGPPYALLQGTFLPARPDSPGAALPKPPPAETGQGARPLIRRGMIAWAGGGGGPDGFVALADHPEWGHGHTVFAEVVSEDMAVLDKLMRERPIRVENWRAINASVFVTPLPFRLRRLEQAPQLA